MESKDPILADWQQHIESKEGEWYAQQTSREHVEQFRQERAEVSQRFPYVVTLEGSYFGLDEVERFCWQHFGPRDGTCYDGSSVCLRPPERPGGSDAGQGPLPSHSHHGTWTTYWIERIQYNYGFWDMCFATDAQKQEFLKYLMAAP